MNTLTFDTSALQRIISDAQKKQGTDKNDYTSVAYLPEGTHTISLFLDPEIELFRHVAFHKFDKSKVKSLCPNDLNRANAKNPEWADYVQSLNPEWKEQKLRKLPDCEICAVNEELKAIDIQAFGDEKKGKSWLKKVGLQHNNLVYMNLYETTAPGDYWKPNEEKGTPYVIVGSTKLRTAILSLLDSFKGKSGSHITRALNPTVASPPLSLTRTGGTGGGINISFSPEEAKPPIIENMENPPVWWRPLKQVFLSSEFDLNAYLENVDLAKKILETYKTDVLGSSTTYHQISTPDNMQDQKKSNQIDSKPFQLVKEENNNILKVEMVPTQNLHFRDNVDTVEPLTKKEEQLQNSGELAANQREHDGEILTLPDFAVERNCWGNYEPSDALCVQCPVNLNCFSKQLDI